MLDVIKPHQLTGVSRTELSKAVSHDMSLNDRMPFAVLYAGIRTRNCDGSQGRDRTYKLRE